MSGLLRIQVQDAELATLRRELRARAEPKFDSKPEPKFDFKPETRTEPPATPGKNLYENLEEEMASLLGRPPGKS